MKKLPVVFCNYRLTAQHKSFPKMPSKVAFCLKYLNYGDHIVIIIVN